MFIDEISTADVLTWIEDCAQKAADVDECACEMELHERVACAIEDSATYLHDALTLIAHYGAFDALRGCDYEDSAIAQFERDVYARALQIQEES